MRESRKNQLQLLFTIDELMEAFEDGAEIHENNWQDMKDALLEIGRAHV